MTDSPLPLPEAAVFPFPVFADDGKVSLQITVVEEKNGSPLPGVILEVCVNVGDTVKTGQKVAVLEAMKMENVIPATHDGKVTAIKVNKGDSILEGAEIVIIG